MGPSDSAAGECREPCHLPQAGTPDPGTDIVFTIFPSILFFSLLPKSQKLTVTLWVLEVTGNIFQSAIPFEINTIKCN